MSEENSSAWVTEATIVDMAWLLVIVFTIAGCAFLNCAIEEQREKYHQARLKRLKEEE